jgi:hypothetical protein
LPIWNVNTWTSHQKYDLETLSIPGFIFQQGGRIAWNSHIR